MQEAFRRFLAHIRSAESDLPPWEIYLGAGMVAAYALTLFASLLFITSMSNLPADSPEPKALAWANLMGGVITLMLIFQYITTSLERAEKRPAASSFWTAMKLNPSQTTSTWVVMMMAFIVAVGTDTIGLMLNVPLSTLPAPLAGLPVEISTVFVAAIFVVVLVRPVVEELIFRGAVYGALLKQFSPMRSIGITALLFASFHYLLDPTYVWWGFVQPLILGLTAGAVRAATKSTRSAIGAHVMFGVFIVLRAILS